jgi:serine O-acetyltransferase
MPRDRLAAARFVAYGTPAEGCPDPVLATIENLRGQLVALQTRVGELEARLREVQGDEAEGEYVQPKEATLAAMGEQLRR